MRGSKARLGKPVVFKTKVERFADFPMFYLEVPPKAIKALGGKFRLRLVCQIDGHYRFQCGLMALGEGRGYITLAKHHLAALGLRGGDSIKVELKPDPSKYGMKVPAEFEEVLKLDPEGKKRFGKLPPGKQRTMIFFVSGSKNVDLRIERALRLLENLKGLPEGKETIPGILGKSPKTGSGRW